MSIAIGTPRALRAPAALLAGLLACSHPAPPESAEPSRPADLPSLALAGDSAPLTGEVRDYHGRPLAGALVTASDDRLHRNVSIFTDGSGHYAFPDLAPGSWRVGVRILGFERRERRVELAAAGADVDFQLRLDDEAWKQLPASYFYERVQWPDPVQRENFALACANCHQIGDPLWRKPRTPADWEAIVARMEFRGPPLLKGSRELLIPTLMRAFDQIDGKDFALPPPPSGDAVRAVLREYEVDPEGRNGCHDLELGHDGWLYTEDGFALNVRTLERKRFPAPPGAHSIEIAPDGLLWITVTGTDLMTRIDPRSGEVRSLEHPQIGDDKGVYPHTLHFDDAGRIWYTLTVSNHVAVLDPQSEQFRYYDLPKARPFQDAVPIPIAYGLDVAPDQTVWWSQLLSDRIGVVDPETGEVRAWQTPFPGPRRLKVGGDGAVWVPGYSTGVLGRFDPRTEQWKVYPLPTKPAGSELPYALGVNRASGDVWIAGSNSDTLIRFEPASERFTAYPIATPVDFTREIEFDAQGRVWTCVPDRGTGPDGPLSGRFLSLELLPREGRCGDRAIQLGEQCDDGNAQTGDGCDAECNLEADQRQVAWED